MALQRDTKYPGRYETGDAAHPQGAFKNRTTPTSEDGSYMEKDWLNDWSGFLERSLTLAGVSANGTADDATDSQYFEAIQRLSTAWSQYTDAGIANAYVLSNNLSPILAPVDGMRVRFYAANASTGASTIDFSDFDPDIAAKTIKLQDGSDIGAGDIDTTIENEIVFDASNDWWTLVRGAGTQGASVEPIKLAQVLCSYNQVGTTAILKSHNVASIVDLGTGQAQINFSVTFSDTNYIVVTGGDDGNNNFESTSQLVQRSTMTTTSCVIQTTDGSVVGANIPQDQPYVTIAVYGDLA